MLGVCAIDEVRSSGWRERDNVHPTSGTDTPPR